jgi:hypothetical protein
MTNKNWKSVKACRVDAQIKTRFIMKYDGLHTLSFPPKEQKDLVYHAYHVNNGRRKNNIKIGRMSSILCFEWAHYKIRLIISI